MTLAQSSIAERLAAVKSVIVDTCQKLGRLDEVTLIAVSKGQDFSAIKEAYECGQRHFGENYPQELLQKMATATAMGIHDITWHFIGTIQSNKLKIIKQAHMVHSIDSLDHARALAALLDAPKEIFLQINLDDHPRRQGFSLSALEQEMHELSHLEHINVVGLMAILPLETHQTHSFWFEQMKTIKEHLESLGLSKSLRLSMGMSDDFVEAIAHGANYVRIGTKIFGPRK